MISAWNKALDDGYLDYLIADDYTPAHLKGIFRAVRDHKISFMTFPQNGPKVDLEKLISVKAFVAIIGDDMDCSLGPDHFDPAVIRKLLEKAAGIAIISSALVENVYALFAEFAGIRREGMVIIETRPEHEMQWIERVSKMTPKTFLIVTTPPPKEASKHS
jgi:hypothetical protein